MEATTKKTTSLVSKGEFFNVLEKDGKISLRKQKISELKNSTLLKLFIKLEREEYKESSLSPLAIYIQTLNNLENKLTANKDKKAANLSEYTAFKIAKDAGLFQQSKQAFYTAMKQASKEKQTADKKISTADLRFFAVNAITLQVKNAMETNEYKDWLENQQAKENKQRSIATVMASVEYAKASKTEKAKMLADLV